MERRFPGKHLLLRLLGERPQKRTPKGECGAKEKKLSKSPVLKHTFRVEVVSSYWGRADGEVSECPGDPDTAQHGGHSSAEAETVMRIQLLPSSQTVERFASVCSGAALPSLKDFGF